MRTLLQDLRYGARMVRSQPGFSAVVVLTLALAIGANTVIFSFANVLLVRPRVSPSAPGTYGGAAGTLAMVALVATYIPVRRATRIDPIRALRLE